MQKKKMLTVMLMVISMVFMTGNLWAAGITETEAMNIAKGFVKFQGEQGGFTAWAGATVSKLEKFYSSNGIIVAYEASVKSSDGQPKGYVMVNARKGGGVAPMFSPEGEPASTSLNNYYDVLVNVVEDFKKSAGLTKFAISDHVLLATLPAYFAVGIKFANTDELKSKFPDVADALAQLPEQDGWIILSDAPENIWKNYHYDEAIEDPTARGLDDCATKALQDSLTEEDTLRQSLMNQDFTAKNFEKQEAGTIATSDSKGSVTIGVGAVGGSFAPYYQEILNWTKGKTVNGKCAAGCGPVAWAIVLDYWDRYGYSDLIPNGNYHPDCRNNDVRNMINALRGYLKAGCDADYQSGVYADNMSRGIYYAKDRGYNFKSSTYASTSSNLWEILKNSINIGWPAIVLIDSQGKGAADHYVVVDSYKDYSGTSMDYYCARLGWGPSQAGACITSGNLYTLTMVQPGN